MSPSSLSFLKNWASLTLAFEPVPTHSFSFHALSLSEAHSFGEAAFSAAGTDGTMRRYNILASLHFPFRGVLSLVLAEAQLGRKQDNRDGKWLACVPGWIAYNVQCTQYGRCKCWEKLSVYSYIIAVIRGLSAAEATSNFFRLMLLLFRWQQLICSKCFHLGSVTHSCNS